MIIHFTVADLEFLRALGIDPESSGAAIDVAHPDGTVQILHRLGIPVTRENYLRVAFMGNPPEEPLDGEIEAILPKELQRSDEDDHLPPDIALLALGAELPPKLPRDSNRLRLTGADRRMLREMGISR